MFRSCSERTGDAAGGVAIGGGDGLAGGWGAGVGGGDGAAGVVDGEGRGWGRDGDGSAGGIVASCTGDGDGRDGTA